MTTDPTLATRLVAYIRQTTTKDPCLLYAIADTVLLLDEVPQEGWHDYLELVQDPREWLVHKGWEPRALHPDHPLMFHPSLTSKKAPKGASKDAQAAYKALTPDGMDFERWKAATGLEDGAFGTAVRELTSHEARPVLLFHGGIFIKP